jgi:hypothetical protein
LQVEHVLSERRGPPDLLALEGFGAPAVTQYTVNTPDLLRSFRQYNAGKPYHRQVRPFGFMVMFQQMDDGGPTTVMRVMAPFNRNPLKAAVKAFDRDTGASVKPRQLKTYARSLEHYHNHPEAKFLNGERADRGPTLRRHIGAKSIVLIGKEANKLDIQSAAGIDPGAQAEFHGDVVRASRVKAIGRAAKRFGPTKIARESGLSRKHVTATITGTAIPSEFALSRIERAVLTLEVEDKNQAAHVREVLAYAQLVEYFKAVLAPVVEVHQRIVQLCTVFAGEAVACAQSLGCIECVRRDNVFQQAGKFVVC